MGKLELKHEQINKAIRHLKKGVDNWTQFNSPTEHQLTILEKADICDKKDAYETLRESLIQRFEISTDLFWKYLKLYLTEKLSVTLEQIGPSPIIRASHKAKLLTEKDTETFLQMIKDRNQSSHIYKEEIAEKIVNNIPAYYELMKKYINKLTPLS